MRSFQIENIKTPVVSVIGAGGKTTLIRALAEEYQSKGIPVIVTTTTHMLVENLPWFLLTPSPEGVKKLLGQYGMAWIGIPQVGMSQEGRDKGGGSCSHINRRVRKMGILPREFLEWVLGYGVPVLIEADGARGLPIKAPAGHEPVLLPQTTHVLNVYGLDAIGKRISEVCFRGDRAAELLGKKTEDILQEGDIAALALSRQSGRKGAAAVLPYKIVLNKADNAAREKSALRIGMMAWEKGFGDLTVTAAERQREQ